MKHKLKSLKFGKHANTDTGAYLNKDSKSLQNMMTIIRSKKNKTKIELEVLIEQAQAGNEKSINELIKFNFGMIISIAKRIVNNSIDITDLIQEGSMGILAALKKYDKTKDTSFATFAAFYITAKMKHFVIENSSIIVDKKKNRLKHLDKQDYKSIEIVRGDHPSNPEDERCIFETIGEIEYKDEDQQFNHILFTELLNQNCNPREREILIDRYIYDFSLETIGIKHNRTKERIRQIIREVLKRMRINGLPDV